MSVTLDDLISLVDGELENRVDKGGASATGATGVLEYFICPPFRSIVDDADFLFYVDNVLDTAGSMDFDSGVYTLAEAHNASTLRWDFNYVYWSLAQKTHAVNAAIGMMFPAFYKSINEDITTDGTTDEYTLTAANVEELRNVRLSSDGTTFTGMKRSSYELDIDGDDAVVRFFSVPPAGTARVYLIARPTELATNESILDIPDRAAAPIVSYACYHLLNQKQAPRLRSDVALATVGGGNLSPRQMNDASNSFFLRYQMQLEHLKQRPWRTT